MRRAASIILLIVWCSLGTGLLAYLHDLQHASDDTAAAKQQRHDEGNCAIHAQLHMPMLGAGIATAALAIGLAAAFVLYITVRMDGQFVPQRLGCRGPPSLAL